MNKSTKSLTEIETELMVIAIRDRYGFDYEDYQKASLQRRLENYARDKGLQSISEMIPLVLKDKQFYNHLFRYLSISVTEMFRDPYMFKAIRQEVVPFLKTYPYINVWNAGCASGEEAYSMAILLKEEELLHRTQIYATDVNTDALEEGKKGIFPLREMQKYTSNYNRAGGNSSFSDYYLSKYMRAKLDRELRDKITFSRHNLVTDSVFTINHLIMCKNVLIYFNQSLQDRVLQLLTDSLCFDGFLCLGPRETLAFSKVADNYRVINRDAGIYQKKIP